MTGKESNGLRSKVRSILSSSDARSRASDSDSSRTYPADERHQDYRGTYGSAPSYNGIPEPTRIPLESINRSQATSVLAAAVGGMGTLGKRNPREHMEGVDHDELGLYVSVAILQMD